MRARRSRSVTAARSCAGAARSRARKRRKRRRSGDHSQDGLLRRRRRLVDKPCGEWRVDATVSKGKCIGGLCRLCGKDSRKG